MFGNRVTEGRSRALEANHGGYDVEFERGLKVYKMVELFVYWEKRRFTDLVLELGKTALCKLYCCCD